MDPKALIRLADAAPRAGTTLADVLALCTRGDDLQLDVYTTPPAVGWPGDEWLKGVLSVKYISTSATTTLRHRVDSFSGS